ncbi:MAG: 6-bladed beta-propeller [Gemmatimonadetes bacterium]|nr:6-bladed beta-propeller [Gemmatimonadota bacterium]
MVRRASERRVVVVVLAGLAIACDDRREPAGGRTVPGDEIGAAVTEVRADVATLPRWTLGETDVLVPGLPAATGEADYYFSSVSQARWLSDGRILVVDVGADELRLFSAAGAYEESYGGTGAGPHEFSWIRSVTIGEQDTVFAYDVPTRSMKVFHPDAGFVRVQKVSDPEGTVGAPEVWRLSPGKLLHAVSMPRRDADMRAAFETLDAGQVSRLDEVVHLTVMTTEGAVEGRMTFPGMYSGLVGAVGSVLAPFSHRPVIHADRDGVIFSSGERFEITEADADLTLRRRIRWSLGGAPVPDEEVEFVRAAIDDRGFERIMAEGMLADVLLPAERPEIQRILVDAGGRYWVSRFEPALPHYYETLWYVLGSDGQPVALLELPPGNRVRIEAVGHSRALVVRRDELDVDNVEVVRIVTPEAALSS